MRSATSTATITTAATRETGYKSGKQQQGCALVYSSMSRRYSAQTNQDKEQQQECDKHYRMKAHVWHAIRY
jgi:hypothetical protein